MSHREPIFVTNRPGIGYGVIAALVANALVVGVGAGKVLDSVSHIQETQRVIMASQHEHGRMLSSNTARLAVLEALAHITPPGPVP